MRNITQHGISLAALVAAGQFAEPADFLREIEGLSTDDIDYVVQNTNPFEQLAPGGLLGDQLFPGEPKQDLQFSYLKGAGNAAVMAHVSDHVSEAPLVGRRGVDRVSGSIPSIRQKRDQDAETLIRLQSADQIIRSGAVASIYDDTTAVRRGVIARLEKLRMDALATGVASQITDEKLIYSVDYQVPAGHQEVLAGADLWTDPASTPLADLEAWQNTMVGDTGQQMANAITSSRILNALRTHDSVRKAVYGVNYDRRLTTEELNTFLASQDLPRFVTYDLVVQVKNADGTFSTVRLWPENRLTLTPASSFGPLGRTFRAPTAEEATQNIATGSIVIDGQRIAVHVYVNTNDPKGLVTLGVASTFPSFDGADHVFQAQPIA